jgi:hypothetical protein
VVRIHPELFGGFAGISPPERVRYALGARLRVHLGSTSFASSPLDLLLGGDSRLPFELSDRLDGHFRSPKVHRRFAANMNSVTGGIAATYASTFPVPAPRTKSTTRRLDKAAPIAAIAT